MEKIRRGWFLLVILCGVFGFAAGCGPASPGGMPARHAEEERSAMENKSGIPFNGGSGEEKTVETATFGLGWFWGPDARFGQLDGVIRTRVGYAGGVKANPTYASLGDHTETLQLDFDPSRISYGELLELFWESHNPYRRSWSRQYRAVLFYHNEEQKRLAQESKARLESGKKKVHTDIEPAPRFYRAEDYHQKYYLRGRPELMDVLRDRYADYEKLVDSTAAARLNALAGGWGRPGEVLEELRRDGFTEAEREKIEKALPAIVR